MFRYRNGRLVVTDEGDETEDPVLAARDTLEQLRRREVLQSRPPRKIGLAGWLILSPFIVLLLYLLLAIIVAAGAAIETAITGG